MTDRKDWLDRSGILLGEEVLERIRRANILIAGVGGVGGIAAELLVRSGIGKITIIDGDTVDDTNRNRQLAALVSTVGKPKTEVLAARFRDINPELELTVLDRFLTAEEMPSLFTEKQEKYDCVLDAIDSVAPKNALIAAALEAGIPVVSSMGAGARLDPEKIRTVPLMKTFNCPLAKAVRSALRGKFDEKTLKNCRAVFSEEPPVEGALRDPGTVTNNKRAVLGTVSYMPAVFGCHCAAAVLHLLKD